MDITRYNMPPVAAAETRLWVAQCTQRSVGLELVAIANNSTDGWYSPYKGQVSLTKLHHMQRDAYATILACRQQLEWLSRNQIEDIPLTDEASLVAREKQRAQVEQAYDAYLKQLASNP
jgi:hypothetical protein